MKGVDELVHELIRLHKAGGRRMTLLAVCPNSAAVAQAAVVAAQRGRAPMLFAATLNQVDRDGGYTGWTPAEFVAEIERFADSRGWTGPLYPCLDHGGPWLKDRHRLEGLTFEQTLTELKRSLTACLQAGYLLLHIDPTVDVDIGPGVALPVDVLIERTVHLIGFAEAERERLGLPRIAYEVGSEEVHGGLVDLDRFDVFLDRLRAEMQAANLMHAWPCLIVAQVGTDLHTTAFDSNAARRLYPRVSGFGSLVKGHYTDDVDRPQEYPACGMGGANVGPEFACVEFDALGELEERERTACSHRPGNPTSEIMATIEKAVVDSGRWRKWLQPDEIGREFAELDAARRDWLVKTGSRYIWTHPEVVQARMTLYANLREELHDPHGWVVDRIADRIVRYIDAFNLIDSLDVLGLNVTGDD